MTRSIDAERALQIVTTRIHLLKNLTSFLTLRHDHRELLACCCIDHEKLRERSQYSGRSKQSMLRAGIVCELLGMRQLLLIVVAPAVEPTTFCDCKSVTESANDLLNRLSVSFRVFRYCYFDRRSVPRLMERSRDCATLTAASALTKRVIAHGHQSALLL